MLGEIQFVMVNGFINERPIPLVGFVGENDARQIKVVTFDDMSTVSVTELVIGDIEAGIFEAEQKTIPVFDRLSGGYVDRTQTTLSIYLNEEMLGDSGLKFLQLVMYNETGEIVKKTNQFIVRVGDSNTPVYYAPETKTVKTLETYVKEITEEAIKLAFGLQEEVTSSSDFVNKKALYVYKGSEEDYQNGYWYYYDDTQKRWVPGGPYKNPTDEVLRLLAQKQDALTFDSTPTEDSQNPVTSDGVFRALAGHQITMDEFPINGSTNPVTSDGLYRKFGEVDAQHQSLSTRVGRIQEEQTDLANGVQQNTTDITQNTSDISQNAANISSQGVTIAKHQTSISENADAIEEVRGIANSASTKADAVDDRLDNIIVESGTSDAETIAARTNSNTGITYTTLAQRLDAENSEIKEDLSDLEAQVKSGIGLTDEVKQALLSCFAKVAWVDEDGQDLYDRLEDALYPPAELLRIEAVFAQIGIVYSNDSLDKLRQNLTVTAYYSDGTSEAVTEYVLAGILTEGTSTVTATYGGKNATFTVMVTAGEDIPTGYTQVDYIASPGERGFGTYIDTQYVPNATTGIQLKAEYLERGNATNHIASGANYYAGNFRSSGGLIVNRCGNEFTDANITRDIGVPFEVAQFIEDDSISVDGTTVGTLLPGSKTTGNLYLFSYDSNASYRSHIKIYYCKIYENGVMVKNYVPCKNASNVYGLYETIGGEFLTSAVSDKAFVGPQ